MLEALEGSQAMARAVALCKPDVVAAYPITPQTHIVENLSKVVAEWDLHTELFSGESGCSAASVVLGAAAARGVPVSVYDASGDNLRNLYEADLAIIRPDQYVAWRGDALPGDAAALVDGLRGQG